MSTQQTTKFIDPATIIRGANARTLIPETREDYGEDISSADHNLARDILNNGQLQPVLVRETKGGYELVAGFRRHYAFVKGMKQVIDIDHKARVERSRKRAETQNKGFNAPDHPGYDSIPPMIEVKILDADSELKRSAANLRENLHRADLHWTERATEIAKLAESTSQRALAQELGIPKSTINSLVACKNNLIPEIWELAQARNANATWRQCASLARLTPENQQAWLDKIKSGGDDSEDEKGEGNGGDKPEKKQRPTPKTVEAALIALQGGETTLEGVELAATIKALRWVTGDLKNQPWSLKKKPNTGKAAKGVTQTRRTKSGKTTKKAATKKKSPRRKSS